MMTNEIKTGDRFKCIKPMECLRKRPNQNLIQKFDIIQIKEASETHVWFDKSLSWIPVGKFLDHFKLEKDSAVADLVTEGMLMAGNVEFGTGEAIKPAYYKFNINGTDCNMFQIARALGLSLELFSALKYFRKKGDTAKQINDLEKAKECIDLEIKRLKA